MATLNKQDIALRVRTARELNGITQVSMAKQLGVARQTYLDIESGKTEPKLSNLYNISEITKYPVMWFLGVEAQVSEVEKHAPFEELLELYKQLPHDYRKTLIQQHISQTQGIVMLVQRVRGR